MRRLLLWLMLLWPVAVHAGSPVPTELYAEVDHGLRPATVLSDPTGYRGRTLLLGGEVEQTVSEPESVQVDVTCYAVDEEDRPDVTSPSPGSVRVTVTGVNGALLQPGRLITLVGEVVGVEQSETGKITHLVAQFVYPWPTAAEEAAHAAEERSRYHYDPWCDPWYRDPWCDPWYYGPYPRWRFGLNYQHHRD